MAHPRWRIRTLIGVGLAVLVIAAAAGIFHIGTSGSSTAASGDRPNVVLIVTDDQRLDEMKYLPKTQELIGDEGLTFTNSISPNSLCCPARAELLTAQYSHNNGVLSNGGDRGGFQALWDKNNTLAKWMSDDGYSTAFVGKYLNGYKFSDGVPDGWDHWDALGHGIYNYTDFSMANDGDPERYTDDYVTTRMTEKMTGYIDEFSESDEPFFLMDAVVAPHLARMKGGKANPVPEEKYRNAYSGAVNPASKLPSYNEKDMSDKPAFMRKWHDAKPSKTTSWFRDRVRTLASVDDHVETIVKALEDTGELDNTVIMFTSDNGFSLGEHHSVFKKWAFDESLRVPLLVRGPGFEAGGTTPRWVGTVDVGQTIVELSGVDAGRPTDGVSFRDASSSDGDRPRPILLESGNKIGYDAKTPWSYRGVRFGRYTYTEHAGGAEELYDSERDPNQLDSKHDDRQYRGILTMMRGFYRQLRECDESVECSLPPRGSAPTPR